VALEAQHEVLPALRPRAPRECGAESDTNVQVDKNTQTSPQNDETNQKVSPPIETTLKTEDQRDEEQDQQRRSKNLLIFGVMEEEREDTDLLVMHLAMRELGVYVSREDIEHTHRVGWPSSCKQKPRAIMVKFTNCHTRRMVFNNKRKLKGSRLMVREDLTAHRVGLVRQAIARYGQGKVWTSEGTVFWIDKKWVMGQATWQLP